MPVGDGALCGSLASVRARPPGPGTAVPGPERAPVPAGHGPFLRGGDFCSSCVPLPLPGPGVHRRRWKAPLPFRVASVPGDTWFCGRQMMGCEHRVWS